MGSITVGVGAFVVGLFMAGATAVGVVTSVQNDATSPVSSSSDGGPGGSSVVDYGAR